MEQAVNSPESVRSRVVPRRRFTRWAAYYVLLYLGLPLLLLGLLVDAASYLVSTQIFGRCFAVACLFN
jgi:hypothetical protein